MTSTTPSLKSWIAAAREELPDISLKERSKGLLLEWSGKRFKLPSERIRAFTPSELQSEESPYLDLRTGTLMIADEDLLIRVQIRPERQGLTPYLAAVLAKCVLPRLSGESAVNPERLRLMGKQTLLREEWSRELGTSLSTIAISRLMSSVREAGLLDEAPSSMADIPLRPTLELIRKSFRLSSLGQAEGYLFDAADASTLVDRFKGDCAWSTPFVLGKLTGGYLTPPEVLVSPPRLRELQDFLGPRTKSGTRDTLLIRPTRRVPLSLLSEAPANDEGAPALNPILAACDGLSSDEPVRRELATRLWGEWQGE